MIVDQTKDVTELATDFAYCSVALAKNILESNSSEKELA